MKREGKYVMLRALGPILFSTGILHSDATLGKRPTSAGMFTVMADHSGEIHVKCYGKSDSLNLGVSPDDSEIIKMMLTGGD